MNIPRKGERVHVWPLRPNVQNGRDRIGQFMPPEGVDLIWDNDWCPARLRDGDISLTKPEPPEEK